MDNQGKPRKIKGKSIGVREKHQISQENQDFASKSQDISKDLIDIFSNPKDYEKYVQGVAKSPKKKGFKTETRKWAQEAYFSD